MAKHKIDNPDTIYDILDRVKEDQPGDYRVGKYLDGFMVPPGHNDREVANTSMAMIGTAESIQNYTPIPVDPGEYEITIIVHMRKKRDFANMVN